MTQWAPKIYGSVGSILSESVGATVYAPEFVGAEEPYPLAYNTCLGGYRGSVPFQRDRLQSLIHPEQIRQGDPYQDLACKLFDNITITEVAAGKTDYRCIWLVPNIDVTNLQVYLTGPRSTTGTYSVWAATASTDNNGNKYVERLSNETTAPAGAAFSTPTVGVPLTLGANVSAGTPIPIFIKRVIGAGIAAYAYDSVDLVFKADNQPLFIFRFYFTICSGISTVTISGFRDGEVVTPQGGEWYTIYSYNSSNAALDPPSSKIILTATGTIHGLFSGTRKINVTGASYSYYAKKLSTGVFQVFFQPPTPGHYQLEFDLGGEYWLQRSVEVSPIA